MHIQLLHPHIDQDALERFIESMRVLSQFPGSFESTSQSAADTQKPANEFAESQQGHSLSPNSSEPTSQSTDHAPPPPKKNALIPDFV